MAIPSIPQNFYVQTGNAQNYLSWAITAAATSYQVQRSTDNVTFANYATPSTTDYLDTSVTIGTTYYYKVAGVSASGTGAYTASQAATPTNTGDITLGQIRLAAQQRADRVNSNFVTLPEWNSYINQSLYELYDLLITVYEDLYIAAPLIFTVTTNQNQYDLPNGTNYNSAPALYKLVGVDLALNSSPDAFVTVQKFNFIDRNKYIYPNTASTIYGVFNLQYRLMGDKINLIPTPSNGQQMRLWYIPKMPVLLKDNDITTASVSGWIEYVIVDAAIKALQKQECDVTMLMTQKQMLKARIESSAQNRDAGQADTISDTRSSNWNTGGPYSGFKGGW